MTFFIQMCSICIILAVLKIYFSKMIITCINSSFSGAVKNRNTIISTNLNHSIHHFLSITSCKIFTVPSGKEKNLSCGILFNKPFTQHCQPLFKYINTANWIQFKTIIVPTHNNNIIQIIRHFLISYIHRFPPTRATISNAAAVLAII